MSNFGEEVFMPLIDGEKSFSVTLCFFSRINFARMEINIPGEILGFRSAILYMFLV